MQVRLPWTRAKELVSALLEPAEQRFSRAAATDDAEANLTQRPRLTRIKRSVVEQAKPRVYVTAPRTEFQLRLFEQLDLHVQSSSNVSFLASGSLWVGGT